MICSEEFIKNYNDLFKTIHQKRGRQAVRHLWEDISDAWLDELRDEVERYGLYGALRYWSDTLRAENANYQLRLKDNKLTLTIHECPSLRILDKPYKHYCDHCDVLYRRALEGLGYKYEIDFTGKGQCKITVSK